MYNIYYIGAQNSERIDFCQWPYMVTGGDLFDGEFDAIEDDDRIQGWERKITSKKLNIEIHAVGVSLEQAIDQLENVAEKDVLNTTPGRLYVGPSYMKGWLVGTTKDRWLQDLDSISNELTFKSDYPYWITEEEFRFYKQGSEALKHWNGWNILTMYLMNFLRSEISNISTTVIIQLLDSR